MMLSDETKQNYILAAFQNIAENKIEDLAKNRAAFIGKPFRELIDDPLLKRNRWFFLLRCLNDFVQYEIGTEQEQLDLLSEFKKHPYFTYLENAPTILYLFENRKEFRAILQPQRKEIAEVFLDLYNLNEEVQAKAIRQFCILTEDAASKKELRIPIKLLKKKHPLLFKKHRELFEIALPETLLRKGKSLYKKSLFQNITAWNILTILVAIKLLGPLGIVYAVFIIWLINRNNQETN